MIWRLPERRHEVFRRNPLAATVVELRFNPILKVPDRVADFQDRIRETFPYFRENRKRAVSLEGAGTVEISEERQFQFRQSELDTTVTLATTSLALERKVHTHHMDLFRDFAVSVKALTEIYKPIQPTRLGLRYVNFVDREQIAAGLGIGDLAWDELISEDFLKIPGNLADVEGAVFLNEITSSLEPGAMTVRYGLTGRDDREVFRIDVDRYLQERFDPADILGLLERFSRDVYSLFIHAVNTRLYDWMEATGDA